MDTPHGKNFGPVLTLIVLAILTVGTSFLPASWFGVQPARKTYTKIDLSSISLGEVAEDSDTNGEISWRELVTTSLDPSFISEVEGEDEKPDPKVIASLNDPNNLTASFSKNLYSASAYFSKNQLNDPLAEQEVLTQLMAQEAEKVTPAVYGFKDIRVAKTEDKESIRAYGNAVATILNDMITQDQIVKDMESITKFIDTKSASDLIPLTQDYERVAAKLEKLLSLSVPLSASTYHVVALTRVAAYRDVLYNLSQAEADPLRTTLFIQKYPDTTVSTLGTFSALSPYFDIKNIVFTSKEPGYSFTVGYTLK